MEVALSEGRLSKWEQLLEENTEHQFQVLQAFRKIRPWGDQRTDLREAVMATSIAAALSLEDVSAEQFADRVQQLLGYLGDGTDSTKFVSPNAAAATMRQVIPAENK